MGEDLSAAPALQEDVWDRRGGLIGKVVAGSGGMR